MPAGQNTSGSQILPEGLSVGTSGLEGQKRGFGTRGGPEVAGWSQWGEERNLPMSDRNWKLATCTQTEYCFVTVASSPRMATSPFSSSRGRFRWGGKGLLPPPCPKPDLIPSFPGPGVQGSQACLPVLGIHRPPWRAGGHLPATEETPYVLPLLSGLPSSPS